MYPSEMSNIIDLDNDEYYIIETLREPLDSNYEGLRSRTHQSINKYIDVYTYDSSRSIKETILIV